MLAKRFANKPMRLLYAVVYDGGATLPSTTSSATLSISSMRINTYLNGLSETVTGPLIGVSQLQNSNDGKAEQARENRAHKGLRAKASQISLCYTELSATRRESAVHSVHLCAWIAFDFCYALRLIVTCRLRFARFFGGRIALHSSPRILCASAGFICSIWQSE
jgi:hypothetical protein